MLLRGNEKQFFYLRLFADLKVNLVDPLALDPPYGEDTAGRCGFDWFQCTYVGTRKLVFGLSTID